MFLSGTEVNIFYAADAIEPQSARTRNVERDDLNAINNIIWSDNRRKMKRFVKFTRILKREIHRCSRSLSLVAFRKADNYRDDEKLSGDENYDET